MSVADLASTIRGVKAQVAVPVTYADVWEFWLRNRAIYDAVDFVTIHILPYWEDFPIPAGQASGHVDSIRKRVGAAFPDKQILIGETGWPSAGRMREGALPSAANQARVLHDVLALAKRENYRTTVIEAFDQPWKRRLEGTVGGHWGLFDAYTREPKFGWGMPVSNHPHWPWQAGAGLVLGAMLFTGVAVGRRYAGRTSDPGTVAWAGITANAIAVGVFAPWAAENMLVESLGPWGWIRSAAVVTTAMLAPIAGALALAERTSVPTFAQVIGPRDIRTHDPLAWWLGVLLIATSILALTAALGLAFDPRYRDFPYAPLTAATVPFVCLALLSRPGHGGKRAAAEMVGGNVLLLAAGYILFNEGFANWQSLWFCAAISILAIILLRVRDGRG
jgi:glucan 1,3-beta-glucosidase